MKIRAKKSEQNKNRKINKRQEMQNKETKKE